MTFDQLEPSAKAPWTRTTFLTDAFCAMRNPPVIRIANEASARMLFRKARTRPYLVLPESVSQRAAFRSIPNRGLGPSVIFFTRHPLLDIGRTVQNRYAPRLASVEKPNTLDVDKIHFLDVQNYQCSAAVDLSLNLVQILRSQFSAEPNSRLEPFNLQGHDCRLPTLPLIHAKRVPFTSY